MNETQGIIREKLIASGITSSIEGEKIIVKYKEGRIVVSEKDDVAVAEGKLNFSGKLATGMVVFFIIIVAEKHFSGSGSDIYLLFVILESLYLLYCHLIIEFRRLQVEKILRT